MKLPILDLIVFVFLTFGNVIFGAGFFCKKKTSAQFTFKGGRSPDWVVGIFIFATILSRIGFQKLVGNTRFTPVAL